MRQKEQIDLEKLKQDLLKYYNKENLDIPIPEFLEIQSLENEGIGIYKLENLSFVLRQIKDKCLLQAVLKNFDFLYKEGMLFINQDGYIGSYHAQQFSYHVLVEKSDSNIRLATYYQNWHTKEQHIHIRQQRKICENIYYIQEEHEHKSVSQNGKIEVCQIETNRENIIIESDIQSIKYQQKKFEQYHVNKYTKDLYYEENDLLKRKQNFTIIKIVETSFILKQDTREDSTQINSNIQIGKIENLNFIIDDITFYSVDKELYNQYVSNSISIEDLYKISLNKQKKYL